ncbi:filamentous hemagglutinin N-terminal domain-containing protein [Roseibium sp.]|uniref:filamentous hemagglutinin N-terminal domain-containing protein n=1 Tax=Roseibium sp. TaxID=1936156 RepID=UPI003A977563
MRGLTVNRLFRGAFCFGFTFITSIQPLLAGPAGGRVTAGSSSITQSGTTTTIDQSSNRLVIEWDSFDTNASETVRFNQPGSSAWALNRVLSNSATKFDGSLFANGNVAIVNRHGIHFGPNSVLDVGGLIASSADISNDNFMNGRFDFDKPGVPDAMVTNAGRISVRDTGLAALVAPGVENSGYIQANLGTVILGAGETHSIDFRGDGLINFTLTSPTRATPKKEDGSDADALVSNKGEIVADGGSIVMTASQASRVLDQSINMSGIAQANSVGVRNGRIVLGGGRVGKVRVSGKVLARVDLPKTGEDIPLPPSRGGTVHITGEDVEIASGAEIDVSGTNGGGTALIGGAKHGGSLADDSTIGYLDNGGGSHSVLVGDKAGAAGNGFMPTADSLLIEAGATIDASSTGGNGGTVIAWGNDALNFHGLVDTIGGNIGGGDDGFVEMSTKGTGVIGGTVRTGYMLVDPGDVCVSTASTSGCTSGAFDLDDAIIEGVLNVGGTFELNTDTYGTSGTGKVEFGGGGNVTINNNTGTMGTFIIHAADTIDTVQVGFLTNGTTGTNYEWYAGSSATASPVSSADIIHFGQVFNTGGGHVIFDAANDVSIGDPLTTSGGDVSLIARGSKVIFRTSDAYIDSSGGAISIQADTLQVNGSATFDPLINAGTGTVSIKSKTAGRKIVLGGNSGSSLSINNDVLDRIEADTLSIGDSSAGSITIASSIAPAQVNTLSLTTGGAVVDGNASGTDVTVDSLAVRAGSGISLDTAVSYLAFSNTSGDVDFGNTGALTIASVDGLSSSSNAGTTLLTAGGPITFAANVANGGSLTAAALESGVVDTENITVNAGVTVQSTGGNLSLLAGDDVIVGSGATVSANSALTLSAGSADTDFDGGLTLDPTANLAAFTMNISAYDDITFGSGNQSGAGVSLDSSVGTIYMDDGGIYSFRDLSVTGNTALGGAYNSTGTQTFNGPALLFSDTLLASSGGGNITFNSTLDGSSVLTVNTLGTTAFNGTIGLSTRLGGLTTDAGGTTAFNTGVTSGVDIQGDAHFGDDVTVSGGGQIWALRGNTTFDGTLIGDVDIILRAFNPITFNDAVSFKGLQVTSGGQTNLNGGSVTTTEFGQGYFNNVVLGADTTLTSNDYVRFHNALDGAYDLTINAPGVTNFRGVVGGTTALTSVTTDAAGTSLLEGGAFTLSGNTLTFNDAVTLGVDTTITDAGDVTFNNTVDGAYDLTVNSGGTLTVGGLIGGTTALTSFAANADAVTIAAGSGIATDNGAIDLSADSMSIAGAVNAGTGIVTLAPGTVGRTISLGTEVVGSLSLTDAEIDLITAGILRIGSSDAGSITFNGTISPANTSTLSLITGDEILDTNSGVDVQVSNLAIQSVNGIANNELLETEVDTVAARNTTGGGIAILETSNGGDLIIGTVDGVVGLRNTASTGFSPLLAIQLETTNGDLTVNNDIYTSRRNMFLVAQQSNGGAGDSTFTNNANIIDADSGSNANNGQIDIRGNNIVLSQGSTISAVNRVILEDDPSSTATVAIDLGGADGVNTLGLTDTELDTVTTPGVLQIGHSGSGDITITDAITLDPSKVGALELRTGGSIIDANAADPDITVGDLTILSATGIGAADHLNVDATSVTFTNSTSGDVDITNTGSVTATGTSNVGSMAIGASTFNVANSASVTATGSILIDAPIVNLDGNLTAPSGITGTATTVNVLGSTGGAELNDAVDVAATGATVNVLGGTYNTVGGVILDVDGLTMQNVDDVSNPINIVNDAVVVPASPGFTISADGVTLNGFSYSGTGGDPAVLLTGAADNVTIENGTITGTAAGGAGILVDNTVTAGLDLTIDNVTMSGVTGSGIRFNNALNGADIQILNSVASSDRTAVLFNGAISNGTRVTIQGNSQIAALVDTGGIDDDGISFAQSISGASTQILIADNADISGADRGISFEGTVTDASVTVRANTIESLDLDGILFNGALTNATVLIGGASAADGNSITGAQDGLDIDAISGGTFTIANNSQILGADGDGIEFEQPISGGAQVNVTDNTLIDGQFQNGIVFEQGISGASMVTIAGNTDIIGNQDGIAVRGDIVGGSAFTVGGATSAEANRILGLNDGIQIGELDGGTVSILNNTGISGAIGDGIKFSNNITDGMVGISGNASITGASSGIEFTYDGAAIIDNSTVSIAGNTGISGQGYSGIYVDAALVNGTQFNVTGNTNAGVSPLPAIGGFVNGIEFAGDISDSGVLVSGNQTISGGYNGILFGPPEGIGDIDNSVITIADNTGIEGTLVDGVQVASRVTGGSEFSVAGNDAITGGETGLDFLGVVLDSTVNVAGNTSIEGTIDDGIWFYRTVRDSAVNIGPATVDVGGTATTYGGNGTISGGTTGIETWILNNTDFTVGNNTEITGGSSGFDFDAPVRVGSTVNIVGNTSINGGDGGIAFWAPVTNSTVNIAGNDEIRGDTYEAIYFDYGIRHSTVNIGPATVAIDGTATSFGGNGTIRGGDDAIEFMYILDSNVTVAGNTRIEGDDDGIDANDDIEGGSTLTIADNGSIIGHGLFADPGKGITIDGAVTDSTISVTGNTTILGETGDGVLFLSPVTDSTVTVAGNGAITGQDGHGVTFADLIDPSTVDISGNTLINGMNGNGIDFSGGLVDTNVTIGQNDQVSGSQNAVFFNSLSGSTIAVSDTNGNGGTNGFLLTNNGQGGSANTLSFANSAFTGTTGTGLSVINGNSAPALDIDIASTGGNTFTGQPSMYLSGPRLALVGDTLGDTAFNAPGRGNFIVLANGGLFEPGRPTIIDGNSAIFDGVPVPAKSLPALIQSIEDRIIDFDDDNTLGQIFFVPLTPADVMDVGQRLNAFFGFSIGDIETTNIQAPGDWILRPPFPWIRPYGNPVDRTYRLGGCRPVLDNAGHIRTYACASFIDGTYPHMYMSALPFAVAAVN